jgi:ABC-2 type transport system permease protein
VARVFARLKLRLLRNGLRDRQRATMFLVSAIAGVILAFVGFSWLASTRSDPARAADHAVVLFGAVTLGWMILPVMSFSSDETLDPQRLLTLPLDRGQIVRGLTVAGLVGIASVAVTAALCGAFVALAHDPAQGLLIAVAIIETLLLGVVASRTLVAVLAPVLRSRRGRDALVAFFAIGILAPQLLRFVDLGGRSSARAIASAARIGRWVPFALGGTAAGEAGRNHLLPAAGELVLLGVFIVALAWIWGRSLERALTTADAPAMPAPARRVRSGGDALFPRVLPFLPRNRVGAIAAKDLRYLVRDPRRRGALISALVYPILIVGNTITRQGHKAPAVTLLALVGVLTGSQITLNQFGLDGDPLWAQVGAGNDPRADLTGKNLATAVMTIPLIVIVALPLAALTGGWWYLPLTIGLAPAAVGITVAIGNVTSVRMPFGIADRRNPLAANSGRGCAAVFVFFGALILELILAVPVGVVTAISLATLPLAVATVVAVVAGNLYGFGLWLAGRAMASRYAYWRLPEILDAVSARRAP